MYPLSNELVASLSSAEQASLLLKSRLIEIKTGDILKTDTKNQSLVYFLTSGSVALFLPEKGGDLRKGLALGLIGKEGSLGLQAVMGFEHSEFCPIVQSPGYAYVIEAKFLRNLMKRYPRLLMVFSRYLWKMYQDIAKLAVLSHHQDITLKLVHWLILSVNKIAPDPLYMTHDYMARMLGVRRASITISAKSLKSQHLIDYSRGHIRLIDKVGLLNLIS